MDGDVAVDTDAVKIDPCFRCLHRTSFHDCNECVKSQESLLDLICHHMNDAFTCSSCYGLLSDIKGVPLVVLLILNKDFFAAKFNYNRNELFRLLKFLRKQSPLWYYLTKSYPELLSITEYVPNENQEKPSTSQETNPSLTLHMDQKVKKPLLI